MDATLAAWLDALGGADDAFAARAWRLVLRREPEPEALERTVAKLREGTLSRATLLQELVSSVEFERVAVFDDALAFAAASRRAGARPRNLTAPPGTDERAIEIPWCLARHAGEPDVLDVGYAFAEPQYLAGLLGLGATHLVGIDLAAADVPGLEGVLGDVRSLPFDDRAFDVAFCISTLEHVGRDNSVYGLSRERDEDGEERALRELRRVLRRGGRLLLTVPAGEEQDLGSQVQRPPREWVALFERAGLVVFEDEVYELTGAGWRSTGSFSPAGVRYGERGPGASAVLCAELRPRSLRELFRLAVRDRRRRDEPRRSTRGDV